MNRQDLEERVETLEEQIRDMAQWIVDWEAACEEYERSLEQGIVFEPDADLLRDKKRDN